MNNFKLVLKSSFVFLLLVFIISSIITYPYFHSETYHYQDGYVRDEMAGDIDLIICGASQAQRGISPTILDKNLDVNSYNIGSPLMTFMGRYYILKKEIERNPVDTVVIELCYDTLARDRNDVSPEGEFYLLGRFTSARERWEYFFKSANFDEYAEFYHDTLKRGLKSWKTFEEKKIGTSDKYTSKGFEPLETYAIEMPAKENYHKENIITEFSDENLEYLNKIFQLCQENNIKVIVIATPLSNAAIMSYDELDYIHNAYKEICEDWDCEYYNFSLYKGKSELFNDKNAFFDRNHLSYNGATTFSNLLSEIIEKSLNGEDCDSLFFENYEELETMEIIPYHKLGEN